MNTTSTSLAALVLVFASVGAAAHDYALGALKIAHPWARSTVPGQSAGGAFFKVENGGKTADRLLGASSPAADHVELHSMSMDNANVMRMRELNAVEVPAGQSVAFEPGQLHLMLMGLKQPLKAGTTVPLTLKFEKAGTLNVELKVEAP
jgi:hypothetical protein